MRNKRFRIAMVAVLLSAVAIAGCQTAAGSAGAGALLGSVAGGIIGSQSGHTVEGALIGAAVGGLAGLVVHDIKSRRTRTAQQTYQDYDYRPNQGFRMDMKGGSISPGTVAPGGNVKSTLNYAVLGADTSGVEVAESTILRKDGKDMATLDDRKVNRTDGTWENMIEFQVPKNAEEGDYMLAQSLRASGDTFHRDTPFTVRSATAQAPGTEESADRLAVAAN